MENKIGALKLGNTGRLSPWAVDVQVGLRISVATLIEGFMQVFLLNNDPFGNNVVVVDQNAGSAELFRGWIDANATQALQCQENDSGYGNIATQIDGGAWTGRSFLKEGDVINLY